MTDYGTVLLTVRNVAERLVLDPKTVYERVGSGELASTRVARPAARSASPKLSSPATSTAIHKARSHVDEALTAVGHPRFRSGAGTRSTVWDAEAGRVPWRCPRDRP